MTVDVRRGASTTISTELSTDDPIVGAVVGAVVGNGPEALGASSGEMVQRTALLRRLQGKDGARVAVVMAPAGSGKTTLLTQWAQAETRPVASLSVVYADRDRTQL